MGTEEAKLRTLNTIAASLQEIGRVMEAINANLVKFAEVAKAGQDVAELRDLTAEEAYNRRLAQRVEGYSGGMQVDPEHNKFARLPNEFDEHFKKEGE